MNSDTPDISTEASNPDAPGPDHATLSPTPSRGSVFLFGPNGLRAGWRLILYIAMVAALIVIVNLVGHAILGRGHKLDQGKPLVMIVGVTISFLAFFLPALLMARLERRPISAYGLPPCGAFGKLFWEGTLWGISSLSALLVVMRLSGVFYFGALNTNWREVAIYGSLWAIGFILVGCNEEFIFRGYTQFTLTSGIGFWPATLLFSVLFLLAHTGNPGETKIGLVDVFLAGIMLSVALWRTGNLWFPIGLHFGWDWAQSFIYGVPDSGLITKGHLLEGQSRGPAWLSGGTVGPEGSVISAMIEIILIVLLLWRFKTSKYPEAQYLPKQAGALI